MRRKKVVKHIITFFFIIYGIICSYFYLYQENLLFHPEEVAITQPSSLQDYEIQWTHDHVQLNGWYIHGAEKKPLLIYFGGNSEVISDNIQAFHQHFKDQYDIVAFEYRGYGSSQGSPSEKSLIKDGIAIVEHWVKKYGYKPEDIVIIGRSLGTGITMQVAFATQPQGIILVTPYDSINAVAEYNYPYIPIRFLNYNPFLSDKYAPNLPIKGLWIIAENDVITPPNHGLRLASLMAHEPTIVTISKGEHHSIYHEDLTWSSISDFLSDTFKT